MIEEETKGVKKPSFETPCASTVQNIHSIREEEKREKGKSNLAKTIKKFVLNFFSASPLREISSSTLSVTRNKYILADSEPDKAGILTKKDVEIEIIIVF